MQEDVTVKGANGWEVTYRDIPGVPDYKAGTDGSIWSTRQTGFVRKINPGAAWRRLSVYRRPYGARYCVVCFRPEPNGKLVCRYVHRLILETFVGPCPPGMLACHGDGDTSNNRLDNLRWDTHSGNAADKTRHGTALAGSKNHRARRGEMDVLAAFLLRRLSFSQAAIGLLLDMTQSEVGDILAGARWPHVKAAYAELCSRFDGAAVIPPDDEHPLPGCEI